MRLYEESQFRVMVDKFVVAYASSEASANSTIEFLLNRSGRVSEQTRKAYRDRIHVEKPRLVQSA